MSQQQHNGKAEGSELTATIELLPGRASGAARAAAFDLGDDNANA